MGYFDLENAMHTAKQRFVGLLVVALMVGAAGAQEDANLNQLVTRIEGRVGAMRADADLPVSRAAIFRGPLASLRADIETLAAAGDAGVPGLTRLLGSNNGQLRANAAYGLGLVGLPSAAPALAAAAHDLLGGVRYQIAWALGNTGSAMALPALNELASDREPAVAATAVTAAGQLRDVLNAESAETPAQRIADLIPLASSQPAQYKLATYGAQAVPALIAALTNEDRAVTTGAANTLARIGDPSGLEPLSARFIATVDAGAPEFKFAQALAEYNNAAAVWPYLTALLDSTSPTVQQIALGRIARLDNPARLTVLQAFLDKAVNAGLHTATPAANEMQVNTVATAAEILGLIGDTSFVPILNRIINEAPDADKSIVKPIAEAALRAIHERG